MSDSQNFDRDAVLRRIQKALAIAEDSRANEHEALAAARQAEALMRKYQIDHADVIATSIKKGHDLSTEDIVVTAKDNGTRVERTPLWAQWLAVRIAKLNDCEVRCVRVQTAKGYETGLRFLGYTGDVQVSKWMLEYLAATVLRLCKEFRNDYRYKVGGRSTMDAYRKGLVLGICAQFHEMEAEKKRQQEAASASRALVVVKANAIAEHFGETKYGKPQKANVGDDGAFAAGHRDGKNVKINTGAIGGPATGNLRLQ